MSRPSACRPRQFCIPPRNWPRLSFCLARTPLANISCLTFLSRDPCSPDQLIPRYERGNSYVRLARTVPWIILRIVSWPMDHQSHVHPATRLSFLFATEMSMSTTQSTPQPARLSRRSSAAGCCQSLSKLIHYDKLAQGLPLCGRGAAEVLHDRCSCRTQAAPQ